VQFKVW